MKRLIVIGTGPRAPFIASNTTKAKGRRNSQAKLYVSEVRWIRKVFKKGDRQFGALPLSRRLGVSNTVVMGVAMRKMWKHVT